MVWRRGMTYSVDLRVKVVKYIREGGSKTDAVRIFGVSRPAIYSWLRAQDLQPQQKGVSRRRKLDWAALEADVKAHPDLMLRERARRFGVQHHAIWYALRQMEIRRKKNFPIFSGNVAQPE